MCQALKTARTSHSGAKHSAKPFQLGAERNIVPGRAISYVTQCLSTTARSAHHARGRTSKASVRAKQKKAAWNDGSMLQLLVGSLTNSMQSQHKIPCAAPALRPSSRDVPATTPEPNKSQPA